ncbi:hypothetical protein GOBAR_DD26506 [Gossypium barbadense]|nr:hypothetical protein GOBAR_DD26506 [Gossypium barbadense]
MPFSDAQYTIFMHFSLVLAKCSSNSFCPRWLGLKKQQLQNVGLIEYGSSLKLHHIITLLLLSINEYRGGNAGYWTVTSTANAPLSTSTTFPTSFVMKFIQSAFSTAVREERPHNQTVEVFNKSTNLGCKQTVSVNNSLFFALCEVKMFHGAYALIRKMIRKGEVPDNRTYTVLVNRWCSSEKMKEAQDFLEDMSKEFNPLVRGRDLLIEGLLNAGYLESAKKMEQPENEEIV